MDPSRFLNDGTPADSKEIHGLSFMSLSENPISDITVSALEYAVHRNYTLVVLDIRAIDGCILFRKRLTCPAKDKAVQELQELHLSRQIPTILLHDRILVHSTSFYGEPASHKPRITKTKAHSKKAKLLRSEPAPDLDAALRKRFTCKAIPLRRTKSCHGFLENFIKYGPQTKSIASLEKTVHDLEFKLLTTEKQVLEKSVTCCRSVDTKTTCKGTDITPTPLAGVIQKLVLRVANLEQMKAPSLHNVQVTALIQQTLQQLDKVVGLCEKQNLSGQHKY